MGGHQSNPGRKGAPEGGDSLYAPEEGEQQVEAERPPCRSVVITDNQAVMLELVNTSLSEEELVTYTQDRLDMLVQNV